MVLWFNHRFNSYGLWNWWELLGFLFFIHKIRLHDKILEGPKDQACGERSFVYTVPPSTDCVIT